MRAVKDIAKTRNSARTSSAEAGVALVLTLLVVAMLTVVVVGFTTVSRLEQTAARNMTHQASAEQLAQLATGRAMQRLAEAMQAATNAPTFSTQPGQIIPFGAPPEQLYSSGVARTNINRFTTNGLITGNASDDVVVGFEEVNDPAANPLGRIAFYIDDESTKIAVNQANGATTGRTLNPQWPRPFAIQGAVGVDGARAGSFQGILTYAGNKASNSSNWNYFFIPEQLRAALTVEPLAQLTVALETNPAGINTTPWGTPKIQINQLGVNSNDVVKVVQVLSDPKLSQIFGQTFADKYTPEGLSQIAVNMLQLRSGYWSAAYLSTNNTNFGGELPDQTVLGAASLPAQPVALLGPDAGLEKKTNALPQDFMDYIPFPMLAEVAVGGVEYGFSAGVDPATGAAPDDNMTIRFFVACKLFNPFPVDYRGGGELFVQIDKARVRFTNANPSTLLPDTNLMLWRGPDGSHKDLTPGYNDMPDGAGAPPWDPWGGPGGALQEKPEPQIPPIGGGPANFPPPVRNLTPATGVTNLSIPRIAAGSTTNVFIPFTIVTSARHDSTGFYTGVGADMFVIIDQVRLTAEPVRANNVRDWCSGPDMKAALGQAATAQFFVPVGNITRQGTFAAGGFTPGATPALLSPDRWVSIAKIDPRMKPGTAVAESRPAWQVVPASLANTNQLASGPGNFTSARIPADPAYATNPAMAVYNTNLPPILFTSDRTYALAADFGKVFTGVPWRTLRMQPQPVSESDDEMIPDWVVLDTISFGDGTRALNTANPNSRIVSLAGPVDRRTAALRSMLNVLTNAATNLSTIANPLSPGLTHAVPAGVTNLGAGIRITNVTVLGDIASWAQRPGVLASYSASSSWKKRRENLGFPTNALLLPSEMAEIRGIADYLPSTGQTINSNKFNEYRLSTLFPGIGVRSRFFRIYALGEAVAPNGAAVAQAALQTLVEVRTNPALLQPTVHIINQYPPAQ